MSGNSTLWSPVEQAGSLLKKGHSRHSWKERYFVLKGNYLFYFHGRKAPQHAKKLHGVIPLESAKIETELPPSMEDSRHRDGFIITITLHSSHALTCRHPFYVLCAPTQDVQMAWVNAMWQAAIPRADLIHHLSAAGKLADVLASYAQNVQMNFPVADATVLSTSGRARTAALANVGSLAGMIRRHKTAPAVNDIKQLPVVVTDKPGPANVLARTTSGNLVTAPSSSVLHAEGGEGSSAAASPTASSKPNTPRYEAPVTGGGASSSSSAAPAAGKPQPAAPAAVAVSAAAGSGAAAAAAVSSAGNKPATPQAGAGKDDKDKQAVAAQMKAIQEQIERLEKEAGPELGRGKAKR